MWWSMRRIRCRVWRAASGCARPSRPTARSCRSSQITFEHAVLLVNELARGAELRLGDCVDCGGLAVVDSLALGDIRCAALCGAGAVALLESRCILSEGTRSALDPDRHRPNFFAGPYLDRRAEVREVAGWLRGRACGRVARCTSSAAAPRSSCSPSRSRTSPSSPASHPLVREADESQLVLLGWFRGTRCVLLDLDPTAAVPGELEWLPGARFEELRPLRTCLPADEAGLLAYARAMSIWRARHRYCGVCGSPLVAGASRPRHALLEMRSTSRSRASIPPSSCWCRMASARCSAGRPPGRPAAIRPSPVSWSRARASKTPWRAKCSRKPRCRVVRGELSLLAALAFPLFAHGRLPCERAGRVRAVQVSGELEDARWFTREELLARPTAAAAFAVHLLSPDHRLAGHPELVRRRTATGSSDVPARARVAGASALSARPRGESRRVSRAPGRSARQVARAERHPRRPGPARRRHLAGPRPHASLRRRHELPRAAAAATLGALPRQADPAYLAQEDAARGASSPASKPMHRAIPASTCCSATPTSSGTPRTALDRFARPLPAGRLRAEQRIPRHAVAETAARAPALRGLARRGPAADAGAASCFGLLGRPRRPRPKASPPGRPAAGVGAHPVCLLSSYTRLMEHGAPRCCCSSRRAPRAWPSAASIPRASRAANLNSAERGEWP